MATAIVETGSHQISRIPESEYMLSPIVDLKLAKKRLAEFQEFVKEYLIEGEDHGIIPGVKKPCLFKSGADKLCDVYGLADECVIVQQVEDWERGLFDYVIKVIITKKGSQLLISTGLGSCSSYESKYRYRDSRRKCPACGAEAIIKGKEEYGGGWLCYGKKGGCGSKFLDGDQRIIGQTTGVVTNPDMADVKNTILKMAKKRAKVDAVLSATRSSGIFTQDLDESLEPGAEETTTSRPAAQTQTAAQPAKAAAPPPAKAPAAKKQPPKETAAPAAQAAPSGPTRAVIPPMEPAGTNGKQKKDLKTWAREVAAKVQCSPDQLVLFLKRILRVEDLKGAPEGQKIVALNAVERVAGMTWPTGMNAVTAFVRNEGLSADFKAVETAYADLLSTVSDQPPAA
jgi:hypothetical protein